jgi:7-keto-8-aminopelargonate synthetase-like enzyme
VQAGCHSVKELLAADTAIRARSWHSQARSVVFGSGLDANDSTFHVTFWRKDQAMAEALATAFPAW